MPVSLLSFLVSSSIQLRNEVSYVSMDIVQILIRDIVLHWDTKQCLLSLPPHALDKIAWVFVPLQYTCEFLNVLYYCLCRSGAEQGVLEHGFVHGAFDGTRCV